MFTKEQNKALKKSAILQKKDLKSQRIGVRGRRLKIKPDESDTFIPTEDNNLIRKGVVLEAGPQATAKKGDKIIFTALGMDKITLGEESFYYVLDTDQFVLEILS